MKTILKVVVGIGFIGQGLWAVKHPGAPLLITDRWNGRVIEIGTNGTNWNVLGTWSYGGLNSPQEAIPLTNGNWIIADSANHRIIEVDPANKTVVKEWTGYQDGSVNFPIAFPRDVRRCVWYDDQTPEGTDTLLVAGNNGIVEIRYHEEGTSTAEIPRLSWNNLYEAEKRPGKGTPTYLIAAGSGGVLGGVYIASYTTTGWEYRQLYDKYAGDVEWLPCGNILVVRDDYVVEIKEGTPFWTEFATWTFSGGFGMGIFSSQEATLIETGDILIAGYDGYNNGYILRGTRTTEGGSWTLSSADAIYSTFTSQFVDVEEKGIINIAKIVYRKQGCTKDLITLAGVVVPILQPEVIAPPYIVATKTVDKAGPQAPGATLTYTIVLKNTGSGTATNVVVIDQIPLGTEYVVNSGFPEADEFSDNGGQTWTAPESKQITHIKWNIGTLRPGGTYTINFSVRIKE